MFKVGDKVIIDCEPDIYGITIPKTEGVIVRFLNNAIIDFKITKHPFYEYVIGKVFDIKVKHIKLKRSEIKTEVDWLNAIQDNFKEGV